MITVVAVNELKTKLSEILARAQAGATIVIANRGRPFARIDLPSLADDTHGHVTKLISMGLARPLRERLSEAFFEWAAVRLQIPSAEEDLKGKRS